MSRQEIGVMRHIWEPVEYGLNGEKNISAVDAVLVGPAPKPAPRTGLAPACSIVHISRT
jgi:hypothetical protein